MYEDGDVLDHRTRRMIINYISSHPGESFQSIRRVLEINASTLRYHLNFLQKNNQVDMVKQKGERCYYPCNDAGAGTKQSSTRKDLTKKQDRILSEIRNDPGITKKELSQITNLDPKEVGRCIRALRSRRLIWKVRSSRSTGYEFITQSKLKQEMLKLLIDRFLNDEISKEKFMALKEEIERMAD